MTDDLVDEYDYESLRKIMEQKAGRPVDIDEAIRTGDDLIELYAALLGEENLKLGVKLVTYEMLVFDVGSCAVKVHVTQPNMRGFVSSIHTRPRRR